MTAPRSTSLAADGDPVADADADASHPRWLGRASFRLAVASTIVYFAASEGIRNFAAFVAVGLGKLAKVIGVGG